MTHRPNVRHAHLRKRAMSYFLHHTFDETCQAFGLEKNQLRSLLNIGYTDPKLAHLRKDSRRKDSWTFKETLYLLRASGLQSREWIAKKLKRGTFHSVKENASRLNFTTKYINGLPLKWAQELLQNKDIDYIEKKAPDKCFVPWVSLYYYARKDGLVPEHILGLLAVMAKFQKRVHGTTTMHETIERIKNIAGKK